MPHPEQPSFNPPEQPPRSLDLPPAEQVWSELEPEIRTAFETSVGPYLQAWPAQDQAGARERLWQAEQAFVSRTWDTLAAAVRATERPVTLLFDVDETLGHYDYEKQQEEEPYTEIRPAAVPLLRKLQATLGPRLAIGLLTTRKQLAQQVEHEHVLGPLNPYLSRDLLFSTMELSRPQDDSEAAQARYRLMNEASDQEVLEYCRNILDPRHLQADPEQPLTPPEIHKLIILSDLSKQHPDRLFVAVDDFPYVGWLRRDGEQIRGVALRPGAEFAPAPPLSSAADLAAFKVDTDW